MPPTDISLSLSRDGIAGGGAWVDTGHRTTNELDRLYLANREELVAADCDAGAVLKPIFRCLKSAASAGSVHRDHADPAKRGGPGVPDHITHGPSKPTGGRTGVGLGWVGLAASCRSRPSGVGFLPFPTTRLNYLTVRFQGRADYRQPPDPTEAQVGGRYRRPACRRARGQGCGRGLGLARGGQVWPGAPGPVGRPWEPDAEPTGE